MKILSNFKNIRLNKLFQVERNENRKAVKRLHALDISMIDIRKALIAMNGINLSSLKNGHNISVGTLHNTLNGKRTNALAMELIARALNLSVPELFPDAAAPPATGN